jgi:hypothetical protein
MADGGGEVGFRAHGDVSGVRLTLRKGWMGGRLCAAPGLYSLGVAPSKEGEDWRRRIRRWQTRKATMASTWGGRRLRHAGPRWQRETERRGEAVAHARELGLRRADAAARVRCWAYGCLGPRRTQSGRPGAGEGGRARAGRRERLLGHSGRKQRRREELCPFFLFQSIFFKWIFEFSFEFESTTQYKNPMQQHECTFM